MQNMKRIEKLQQVMRNKEISAALLMQHRDLYYYAGTAQPCNLFIPAEGEPVLFVRRAMEMTKKDTWLENLQYSAKLGPIKELLDKSYFQGGKLGVEEDVLPASLYNRIKREFEGFELVNISPEILEQRAIKEPEEQEELRETARLFKVAHETIIENLAPGISEMELAAEVYRRLRANGAEFITYHRRWDNTSTHEGLIAGAKTAWQISGLAMTVTGIGNHPSLPWGASAERIDEGDMVVMDIGINRAGYHVDMARTYVAGNPSTLLKERWDAVNKIMDAALEKAVPGNTAGDLFSAAESKALDLGVREYFQGWGDMQGHYIGHGIGLELDEPPTLVRGNGQLLTEGMAVCIEPKLIVPHWGAVDVEDTVIINSHGPEILTPVSRELF